MRYFHLLILSAIAAIIVSCTSSDTQSPMTAGFARISITPPLGTPMTGFGQRDYDPAGSKGVHDDIFARALYISQGEKKALIMGFDLLFFSRDEADRFKGAIGRRLNLSPNDILLNTSHTHTGPKVGTWFYTQSDPAYLNFLEERIVEAVLSAKKNISTVDVYAGRARSSLPMSRRKKLPNGTIDFAPNPDGPVCDTLPVVMFKNSSGQPVCLLFSVSCHPSTVKGVERSYWISADYPGAAMEKIDDYLGAPVSLFLQGAGGDSKASVIGKGLDQWKAGTWDDVDAAGQIVADEVEAVIEKGLIQISPLLETMSVDMEWRLAQPFSRQEYEDISDNPQAHSESMPEVMQSWAREMIDLLDRGYSLKNTVSIAAHGISFGVGARIVGIEGELVAELGNLIAGSYGDGVTFPLGYTDGAQMYLPTTEMLGEGGYEVESFWEYRQPAPLAGGHESVLAETINKLREKGIQ